MSSELAAALARAAPELGPERSAQVASLAERLGAIPGVAAVVLGGSFARGAATPSSDVDLGVFYRESAPFSVDAVRALAAEVHDRGDPVVTDFWVWGPWVNGGAWLTVRGQRVDFLYRSVEHLERVIADAEQGRFELHHAQQPPFGFFGPAYLGELAICFPLVDREDAVAALKRRVAVYPEPLRRAVVQTCLWAAEFNLESFAPKFADRGDALATAGCLARAAHQLVLALFAYNRRYPLADKTALREIERFEHAPREFPARVRAALAHVGATPAEQGASVAALAELAGETVRLCGPLYRRPYPRVA